MRLHDEADCGQCSVGMPLAASQVDVPWPCDPANTTIAYFSDEPAVFSFGSGYGGNALLAKKCYVLRIASVMARVRGGVAVSVALTSIALQPVPAYKRR